MGHGHVAFAPRSDGFQICLRCVVAEIRLQDKNSIYKVAPDRYGVWWACIIKWDTRAAWLAIDGNVVVGNAVEKFSSWSAKRRNGAAWGD